MKTMRFTAAPKPTHTRSFRFTLDRLNAAIRGLPPGAERDRLQAKRHGLLNDRLVQFHSGKGDEDLARLLSEVEAS